MRKFEKEYKLKMREDVRQYLDKYFKQILEQGDVPDSETANNMMSVIMDASKKFTRKKMEPNKLRTFSFKYHEAYFLIIAFRGIMKEVNDVIRIYLHELIASLDKQMK